MQWRIHGHCVQSGRIKEAAIPVENSYPENISHVGHMCKSMNHHAHTRRRQATCDDTETSRRKSSTETKHRDVTQEGPWKEKDITDWACKEARMTKEDQLCFLNASRKRTRSTQRGDHQWTEERMDYHNLEGQVSSQDSQHVRSLVMILNTGTSTRRFLMVRIPTGDGRRTVVVMVICAYSGRGNEATQETNQRIFDTAVGVVAGMRNTPLMICGVVQYEPTMQSRDLDFALSQGCPTDMGEIYKPPGSEKPLQTYEQGDTKTLLDFALVNEGFRSAVWDFEVVQRNLVPKHKSLEITLNLDACEQEAQLMRQPTTLNAGDQQLLDVTFREK